jgi:hypothetical protein
MKPIHDRTGATIGYESEYHDRKTIQARSGMVLGWHDKHADKTFKRVGSFYGKGDQTMRLLGDS